MAGLRPGHPRLCLRGRQERRGCPDIRAFTPVFDGLCPGMTELFERHRPAISSSIAFTPSSLTRPTAPMAGGTPLMMGRSQNVRSILIPVFQDDGATSSSQPAGIRRSGKANEPRLVDVNWRGVSY